MGSYKELPIMNPKLKKAVLTNKSLGDQFHNNSKVLFENLGFKIVLNNFNETGPDLIIQDEEANKKNKIIVQCKKTSRALTYPSLQNLIDEYRGKITPSRYGADRAILLLSGFKLPKNFNYQETLEKTRVAVLDDGLIEYYSDLSKKIGKFAKYQFLSDIGLNFTFDEPLETEAVEVVQNNTRFFVFAAEPEWLLKTSAVTRRVFSNAAARGYQRLLNKNRVTREIPAFLQQDDWVLPNSVISVTTFEKPLHLKAGKISLESRYGSMWVMDGQHRLYSFSNLPQEFRNKNKIICTLFDSASMGKAKDVTEAQIFIDLNSHAKKVDTSLLLELKEFLGHDDIALNTVLSLSKTGLFKDLLSGYSARIKKGIKLTTFVTNAAMRQIVDEYEKKYPKLSRSDVSEKLYKSLFEYFKTIHEVFKKEWGSAEYIITDNRGVRAFLKIYLKLFSQKHGKLDLVDLKKGLRKLKSGWSSFETKNLRNLYLGEGGADQLATEWLSFMASDMGITQSGLSKNSKGYIQQIIEAGENQTVEMKSSFWWDYDQGKYEDNQRFRDILKTIAGFLNSDGGMLLVGFNDQGIVLGLEKDIALVRGSVDKLRLRLVNLLSSNLKPNGEVITPTRIRIEFLEMEENKTVCVINVSAHDEPTYCGGEEEFFVRTDAMTRALKPQSANRYIQTRFV